MLIDGSYIQMYQCLSTVLAYNNRVRDIKSLLENLGSTYKINSESGELFNDKKKDLLI